MPIKVEDSKLTCHCTSSDPRHQEKLEAIARNGYNGVSSLCGMMGVCPRASLVSISRIVAMTLSNIEAGERQGVFEHFKLQLELDCLKDYSEEFD